MWATRHCGGAKVGSSSHARFLSQPVPLEGMPTEANMSAEYSTQVLGASINERSGGVGNKALQWCQGQLRLVRPFLEPADTLRGHVCRSKHIR